jgi:hypothetical protein
MIAIFFVPFDLSRTKSCNGTKHAPGGSSLSTLAQPVTPERPVCARTQARRQETKRFGVVIQITYASSLPQVVRRRSLIVDRFGKDFFSIDRRLTMIAAPE